MAAVAEHRRLRLDLDCILRDVRASDLPLLEWFGTYAHLRRMEEANYRDVEAAGRRGVASIVTGLPHSKSGSARSLAGRGPRQL